MRHSDTGMRARLPDSSGYALDRHGLRLYYEVFGSGPNTIVLMPCSPISHSRMWKGQMHYLARHFRLVVYDGAGNGLSDHPAPNTPWTASRWANDCLTVMDATGTERAVLVGLCVDGVWPAIQLAASDPERVAGIVAFAPGIPALTPPIAVRAEAVAKFDEELPSYEGWFKMNRHYIEKNFRGFMEFFFGEMYPEPHSTKQIEDTVAYALDGRVETFLREETDPIAENVDEIAAVCAQVRCPVLVIHGDRDNCQPFDRAVRTAELTGAARIVMKGSGHIPVARQPVRSNLLISEFAGRERQAIRRANGHPRAILVSSPIGLGHAWRDVSIARELRRQVPGLEVQWLAQPPLTTLLTAAGEKIHPASAELAPEARHVDAESRGHELHAFDMIRRMDEILCANFMVFHDVVSREHFDVWIADEGWEIDHFLHENPELKTSPYVWMADFAGYLPMPAGGEREAFLTADYNAEVLEHIAKHPEIRDLSIFIGDPVDVVRERFGPGLPLIRDWVAEHYRFSGYVLPFDPAEFANTKALRRSLGLDPAHPLIVATAGGSAVGAGLLHRAADAFRLLRRDVPDAEMLLVCGPRIDPAAFAAVDGMRVTGYVHDLFRTLACCDLAVVQGGLSTTMELVANRRPFIHVPLRNHFEQNIHVAHRLRRYGAPPPTQFDDATPERLAAQMRERLGSRVTYKRVEAGGAARAAALIAPLIAGTRDRHGAGARRRAPSHSLA